MNTLPTPYKIITALLLCIGASIAFIDQPLALWIGANLAFLKEPLRNSMEIVETALGYNISKIFLAYVLLALGIVQFIHMRTFNALRPWIFVSTTIIFSRIAANFLKDIFLRPRPFQFLEDSSLAHFFTTGNSFPSGHVTFFFSIYFPLAMLFPKYKYPLLIIPVLVIFQRILVTDHYISDAMASIIVAYLTALAIKKLLKIESSS